MPDDGQERFEDYLELERYIEELQAGRAAHLPQHLTPSQARIYGMAMQFCSSSAGTNEPRAQFVTDLEARLLDQLKEEQQETTAKRIAVAAERETPLQPTASTLLDQSIPELKGKALQRARFISRRAMLTGGAVAAASLAIGTGVGVALSSAGKQATSKTQGDKGKAWTSDTDENYNQPWLVDSGSGGVPTTWHFVTTIAQLDNQAVQFTAGGVVGYVIQKAGHQEHTRSNNEVIAISAACTHMGCIIQWQNSDRRFHCPCHNGLFTQNGLPDDKSPIRYLAALPRLHVKVENENIYVEVPKIE